MESEKRCRSCGAEFRIHAVDIDFYERVSPVFSGKKELIPPPSQCPDCRAVSRYLWRNEFSRYQRQCALTGKPIICAYSPDKPFTVYSQDAWWSDSWSGVNFGREFNFSRPFFEQVAELLREVPVMATYRLHSENSDYSDWCSYLKNCYFLSSSNGTEECFYGRLVNSSRSCVDCFSVRNCELCYDCTECEDCYASAYCQNSYGCSDSYFLFGCIGCSNCFCGVNLRHREYMWRDEQLTKQDYQARLLAWDSGSYSSVQKAKGEFSHFRTQFPVRYYSGEHNEDTAGNFLNSCRNVYYCFDCFELEDCRYSAQLFQSRDCQDIFTWGRPGELLYYSTATGDHAYRNSFCVTCAGNNEVLYAIQCMNSKYLFGCVGLKRMSHCVLNRQYSEEEYHRLVPKIIDHMRNTGEWGEFFPPSLSHFGYNESIAQDYEPVSRERAQQLGYNWSDYVAPPPQVKKTNPAASLSDNIVDTPDDILDWAIECEVSGRPFRLISQELQFLRTHRIPVPRRHPDLRYRDRLALRNPRKLFSRQCDSCGQALISPYPPDRPERVLCEPCYLKKVV